MSRFRKKPVVVEAVRWCGTNFDEINKLKPGWMSFSGATLNIETLEGTMKADLGDWIIKGIAGEEPAEMILLRAWVCRNPLCAKRFESPTWRRCPYCQSVWVWCLDGPWWKGTGEGWSTMPHDIARLAVSADA